VIAQGGCTALPGNTLVFLTGEPVVELFKKAPENIFQGFGQGQ
jgi:hypothetical protein